MDNRSRGYNGSGRVLIRSGPIGSGIGSGRVGSNRVLVTWGGGRGGRGAIIVDIIVDIELYIKL